MNTISKPGESGQSTGQELHLRSANVDLDGNLVVPGTMIHEPDDHGHFPMFDMTHLRISRDGDRIIRCKATRTESGFLEVEEIGTVLHVPAEFRITITNALRFGANGKKTASLDFQAGHFRNSTDRFKPLVQRLSGWRLSIEQKADTVLVNLSADLLSIEDSPLPSRPLNYWSKRSRITVAFAVDPMTRLACYGSTIRALQYEGIVSSAAAYTSSLSALSLENAPVGSHAEFGSQGKDWVSFSELQMYKPTISFTRIYPPKRAASGIVTDGHSVMWPRICFEGISTDHIAAAFGNKPSFRLALSGGLSSHLQGHHDEPSDRFARIYEASLSVSLGLAGLEFEFQVRTEAANPRYREIHGSCTLCWELLILRYPAFVRHRANIQNA